MKATHVAYGGLATDAWTRGTCSHPSGAVGPQA
jgi:hypothetical protein